MTEHDQPTGDPHGKAANQTAAPDRHTIQPRSALLRVEMVASRMRSWNTSASDPDHIDVDQHTNLDSIDPRYVSVDHPAIDAYLHRIWTEGHDPASAIPDDINELRRRAGLRTSD